MLNSKPSLKECIREKFNIIYMQQSEHPLKQKYYMDRNVRVIQSLEV